MKTWKRLAATMVAQTVLVACAVATGYLTVSSLPVVVPIVVLASVYMSR